MCKVYVGIVGKDPVLARNTEDVIKTLRPEFRVFCSRTWKALFRALKKRKQGKIIIFVDVDLTDGEAAKFCRKLNKEVLKKYSNVKVVYVHIKADDGRQLHQSCSGADVIYGQEITVNQFIEVIDRLAGIGKTTQQDHETNTD